MTVLRDSDKNRPQAFPEISVGANLRKVTAMGDFALDASELRRAIRVVENGIKSGDRVLVDLTQVTDLGPAARRFLFEKTRDGYRQHIDFAFIAPSVSAPYQRLINQFTGCRRGDILLLFEDMRAFEAEDAIFIPTNSTALEAMRLSTVRPQEGGG